MTSDQIKDEIVRNVLAACNSWASDKEMAKLDSTLRMALYGLTLGKEEMALSTEVRRPNEEHTEIVNGIPCRVKREKFPDGWHDVYTFTVPGWKECSITGRREAKRVINGRCDAAVRNTLGMRW